MIAANLLLLGMFVLLMVLGTPIAIALAMGGIAGILVGLDLPALATVGTNTFNGIAKYPLIAIPLFILAGTLFERSGVASRLITFIQAIVGPRRGGLALVAILVCMIMGGMSGSGPADAAAVAAVMIPTMRRAGYPAPFSASVIAAASSTAILIPPSIALILYSILVPGVDLRALFAAGLVPGLLCGLAVSVPAWWLSRRYDMGRDDDQARPPFFASMVAAGPGLFAPVLILGGLRTGLFTPTEAAAVAAVYGLAIGVGYYRTMGWREVYEALADAAETSAVILFVIALAGIFAWAGSTLGAFDAAAAAIVALGGGEIGTLIPIMVLLLVAGMVLDGISIYLITVPLLLPVVIAHAWDPVWFGVLMAMNIAIGQFTPPIAVNLMITARIAGVPLEATVPWVVWLVAAMSAALVAVVLFPGLALWLPGVLGYAG